MAYQQYIPSGRLCRSIQVDRQWDYTICRGVRYVAIDVRLSDLCFSQGIGSLTRSTVRGVVLGFAQEDRELLKANLGLSILGNQLRQALAAAVASYNVWFWFRFKPSGGCEAYILLFARVSGASGGPDFYRAFAIFYLTSQAIKYLFIAAILLCHPPKAKPISFANIWKLYLSASQLDHEEPEHILTLQKVDKRNKK